MRSLRVLVVDDNADHRFLTAHALRGPRDGGGPVEVVEAADGQEALDHLLGTGDHAGRELPDLVLLDLSLPRLGGLEVLARIRADAVLGSLPVVVYTSSERPEDVEAAYAAGASTYVAKSADLAPLVAYWTRTATLPGRG